MQVEEEPSQEVNTPPPGFPNYSLLLPHASTLHPVTFWILGFIREGQGGSWLGALVISGFHGS